MPGQFKKRALRAFAGAGVDRACVSFHNRDALVLVYHGILAQEKPEPFRYHHTAAEFEAHLDWLGTRCTPASLADFARWKGGEWRPRKPPVLVTFDDGYRNNAVVAAPLLKRKGIPALFFLASGYIENDRVLWPDEVFARVCAWTASTLDGPDGTTHAMPKISAERESLALSIVEECKNIGDARRLDFIAYLVTKTPSCNPLADSDAQNFMSWDDVRALGAAGFDLGSHTVTHPILRSLSPSDLRRELRESRSTIEARTGRPCTALAYPNGRSRDIDGSVLAETAEAGYDYAFTVSNRWCRRSSEDLQLDRVSPPGHTDLATFALHASGFRQWLRSAANRGEPALPASPASAQPSRSA
jgi:peptidoglycan/xylan/chitin deacetylase (PgdA/CDA1 family)